MGIAIALLVLLGVGVAAASAQASPSEKPKSDKKKLEKEAVRKKEKAEAHKEQAKREAERRDQARAEAEQAEQEGRPEEAERKQAEAVDAERRAKEQQREQVKSAREAKQAKDKAKSAPDMATPPNYLKRAMQQIRNKRGDTRGVKLAAKIVQELHQEHEQSKLYEANHELEKLAQINNVTPVKAATIYINGLYRIRHGKPDIQKIRADLQTMKDNGATTLVSWAQELIQDRAEKSKEKKGDKTPDPMTRAARKHGLEGILRAMKKKADFQGIVAETKMLANKQGRDPTSAAYEYLSILDRIRKQKGSRKQAGNVATMFAKKDARNMAQFMRTWAGIHYDKPSDGGAARQEPKAKTTSDKDPSIDIPDLSKLEGVDASKAERAKYQQEFKQMPKHHQEATRKLMLLPEYPGKEQLQLMVQAGQALQKQGFETVGGKLILKAQSLKARKEGAPIGRIQPRKAKKLAKATAENIAQRKYNYDRNLLKKFQSAAGIPVDGIYGPVARGALRFYGIKNAPRPLFDPEGKGAVPYPDKLKNQAQKMLAA